MTGNNMSEQMQNELSEEELQEITGGRKTYNKKYDVYVDPDTRKAYRMRFRHGGEIHWIPIAFEEKYLEGI